MSYELFQQGPEVYIPVILLSLIITVFSYGVFPLVFAMTRKTTITEKKYKRLCYGINVPVMFVFLLLNGGVSSGAPYLLWTWIFSKCGIKILIARGIILDGDYLPDDQNRIIECKICGQELTDNSKFCRKCGAEIGKEPAVIISEPDNYEFCKKCGADITNDIDVCHVCGEHKGNEQ